jgi:transcriptional regulator with XRE-family HTH domain
MRKSQVEYLEYAKLVKERLSILIKMLSRNQIDFGKSIDATAPTITEWLGNKKNSIPSAYYLIQICERHNVNINWLLTGKGEIFIKDEKKYVEPYPNEKRKHFGEAFMFILYQMVIKLNYKQRQKLTEIIATIFDQELIFNREDMHNSLDSIINEINNKKGKER